MLMSEELYLPKFCKQQIIQLGQNNPFALLKIQRMYFADSDALEHSLHNDLNTIIKNFKIREQQHLQLSDYNRAVATKKRDIQQTIFLNDQLTKHKNFLRKHKQQHLSLQKEEGQILQKYGFIGPNIYNQAVHRLMSRVGARVQQMFQTSSEKIKVMSEQFQEKHKRTKINLIKAFNQKQRIQINEFFKIIITYIYEKVNDEIIRLQSMIDMLEEGEVQKLNFIFQKRTRKSPKKVQVERSVEKKKQKQKLNDRIVQLKQQAKDKQRSKKQKNKLAQKMIGGLYSTMDIHRNQFIEDMVFLNPNEKFKKLYEQITLRNRYNKQQIEEFTARQEQFHQKVRKFKQMMLQDNKKIQEAVIIRSQPKIIIEKEELLQENPIRSQREIPTLDIVLPQVQVLPCRFTEQRPIRMSIQKAQSPRIVKQATQFVSMQSTAEVTNHLKFDARQQQTYLRSNRARLPQIGRTSVDQTGSIPSAKKGILGSGNRQKLEKDKDRVNIVTNININGDPQSKTKNIGSSKGQSFSLRKEVRPQLDLSKQKKRENEQSVPKSMEYTFYIKKRTNRFYETRNHFIM